VRAKDGRWTIGCETAKDGVSTVSFDGRRRHLGSTRAAHRLHDSHTRILRDVVPAATSSSTFCLPPSISLTASSTRSHPASSSGAEQGTTRSTAGAVVALCTSGPSGRSMTHAATVRCLPEPLESESLRQRTPGYAPARDADGDRDRARHGRLGLDLGKVLERDAVGVRVGDEGRVDGRRGGGLLEGACMSRERRAGEVKDRRGKGWRQHGRCARSRWTHWARAGRRR
jgi:hypothetical protein